MHIYELDFRTFPIIEMDMIFVRFDKNVADRIPPLVDCPSSGYPLVDNQQMDYVGKLSSNRRNM